MRSPASATVWQVVVAYRQEKNDIATTVRKSRLLLTQLYTGSDVFETARELYFADRVEAAHRDFSLISATMVGRADGVAEAEPPAPVEKVLN